MSELIDKQSVLNVLEEIRTLTVNGVEKRSAVYGLIDGYTGMIRCKVNQLSVTQPKRGKWIKTARWGRVYYCNQCRNYLDFDGVNAGRGNTNFCPNCGADMREVTT